MTFGTRQKDVTQDDAELPAEQGALAVSEADRRKAQAAAFDAEQKAKYDAFVADDERDRVESQSWEPEVTIKPGKVSSYICFDGVELPASFIESITVQSSGAGPYMRAFPRWYTEANTTYTFGGAPSANHAFGPSKSSIKITTISGQEHGIQISRHKADALIAALLKAWRENR